jgi:ABC-type glycerol-3-phosphate transport system permease component
MRNRKRVGWHRYINGVNIAVVVTALFILIPLYWLIASSFRSPNSFGTARPRSDPPRLAGETTATRSSATTSASTSGTR